MRYGIVQFLGGCGIAVTGGFKTQFPGCQIADGFAVHGKIGRLGRRDHGKALLFVVVKTLGADGLNFGDNVVRLMFGYQAIEFIAVEHIGHLGLMGYLHGGSSGITVDGNDVLADALGGYGEFFSQFARPEEEDFFHG